MSDFTDDLDAFIGFDEAWHTNDNPISRARRAHQEKRMAQQQIPLMTIQEALALEGGKFVNTRGRVTHLVRSGPTKNGWMKTEVQIQDEQGTSAKLEICKGIAPQVGQWVQIRPKFKNGKFGGAKVIEYNGGKSLEAWEDCAEVVSPPSGAAAGSAPAESGGRTPQSGGSGSLPYLHAVALWERLAHDFSSSDLQGAERWSAIRETWLAVVSGRVQTPPRPPRPQAPPPPVEEDPFGDAVQGDLMDDVPFGF